MSNDIGIYIHIPFCVSKCYYCDFVSYTDKEKLIEKYIYALCNEIINNAEILSQYKISTIYIGGGTPSYIDAKYIVQIMNTLMLFTNKDVLKEVTIEINPNSITKEKLKLYKKVGINRISIGLQTMYNDILKKIGRVHRFEDFENALSLANEVGYDNISLDLIYPLPDFNLEMLKKEIDYVCSLKNKNIKHISIYNLEVHDNTKLGFLLKEGYLSLANEDEEYLMYQYIKNELEKNGFHRYEISNYAIKGYESKHNLKYWNQEQYLGFGVNASSFFSGNRYSNIKSIEDYIENINSNKSVKDYNLQEELDLLSLMKEYVMLGLRKKDGISKKAFKSKYKKHIYDLFKEEIDELVNEGLLIDNNDKIFLSDRGLEVANLVWEKFV